MAQIEFRLFGEPELHFGGTPVAFEAPPRTLPLLAYLLVNRGSWIPRDVLAARLWPDDLESDARANLRRHLLYMKRALAPLAPGDPWIESGKTAIRWKPFASWWLDVAAFEDAVASGAASRDAARLYRGDLFARCDDEWIDFDRERLRQLHFTNLNAIIAASVGAGALHDALAAANQLLAADPWREETVRSLMELRANSGDRAGALAEFERFAARLRDDLAVDPMPETIALFERVKGRSSWTVIERREPAALVGRDSEREALERCWRNALGSHAGVVLIGGEAGTGKSSLAAALQDVAATEGRTFSGTASPDSGAAYAEFADVLRQSRPLWATHLQSDAVAHLCRLLPELGEPPVSRRADDAADQLRLFTAIGDALEIVAEAAPVLIVLEDLHWAGQTTILLLEQLAHRLRGRRVLVVGTYREEDVSLKHPLRRFRRKFARSPFLTHIALSNLNRDDAFRLGQKLLGVQAAPDVLDALYQQSRGNPLMTEELAFAYGTEGALTVGETLAAHIGERIGALEPPAKTIAQAAAVLGAALEPDLIAALTGYPERDVLGAVNELCRRRIFRTHGDAWGSFAFAHRLFADAAYASAPEEWRRSAHARAVLLLEEYYEGDEGKRAAMLAYHAERGALRSEACTWLLEAGRQAYDTHANAEALQFAQRALAQADSSAQQMQALLFAEKVGARLAMRARQAQWLAAAREHALDRASLCEVLTRELELAEAQENTAAFSGALAHLEQLAPAEPLWQGRIRWYRALHAHRRSEHDNALTLLREASRLFREAGDAAAQLRAHQLYFSAALNNGLHPEAALEELRALAGSSQDPDVRSALLLAEIRFLLQTDTREAGKRARSLMDVALESGDRHVQAFAAMYRGAAAAREGDIGEARQSLARARDLFAVAGGPGHLLRVALWEGIAELSIRNWHGAIAKTAPALAAAQELGLYELAMHLSNNLGIALKECGRLDDAREAFRTSLSLTEQRQLRGFRSFPLNNLAFLEFDHGNYATAAGYLEDGLLSMTPGNFDVLSAKACLAACRALLGSRKTAETLLDEVAALIDSKTLNVSQAQDQYWVAAATAHALGQAERARRWRDLAYESVVASAALIRDSAARTEFLEEPSNKEIRACRESDTWPERYNAALAATR